MVDGESIDNELDTMAMWRAMRDKIYIFYKEYSEDGHVEDCRLIIAPNEVELKKSGAGTSILRFLEGTRQECYYQSPMGPLNLESDTLKIKKYETEKELLVEMHYYLYMAGNLMSEYLLKIEVKK